MFRKNVLKGLGPNVALIYTPLPRWLAWGLSQHKFNPVFRFGLYLCPLGTTQNAHLILDIPVSNPSQYMWKENVFIYKKSRKHCTLSRATDRAFPIPWSVLSSKPCDFWGQNPIDFTGAFPRRHIMQDWGLTLQVVPLVSVELVH